MKAHIVNRNTGQIEAEITNHLPYGMTIAMGESVMTIVFSLEIVNNPIKGLKACASTVYSIKGWTRRTHELKITE